MLIGLGAHVWFLKMISKNAHLARIVSLLFLFSALLVLDQAMVLAGSRVLRPYRKWAVFFFFLFFLSFRICLCLWNQLCHEPILTHTHLHELQTIFFAVFALLFQTLLFFTFFTFFFNFFQMFRFKRVLRFVILINHKLLF